MELMAGFSRTNITPGRDVGIEGYFVVRKTEGVLDELELNTLALALGDTRVLLLSADLCFIKEKSILPLRREIAAATGLPEDHVWISCTHTHTGPIACADDPDELVRDYFRTLRTKMLQGACAALEDLKAARFGWAEGKADDMSYGRRLLMKDGTVMTHPGVGNPDIVSAVLDPDHRVNVLRFDRAGADSIVLVNFGCHPDSIGGNRISADWPGFMRRTLERSLDGVKCIFMNGAEGDVDHINIWGKDGYFNDTFNDFDDVLRGYGHSRYLGRYMAGAVLQVFDKVNYRPVDRLFSVNRPVHVPANVPRPEELPQAHAYYELHHADRDSEIPYKAMMLTTVVAEAERMVQLEHGPEKFDLTMSGVAIGPVALVGFPGEPFTGIGMAVKQAPEWELVLPVCNCNGAEGYFPMRQCYEEGGYETRSSFFKPGAAEYLIDEAKTMLQGLSHRG